MSGKIMVIKIGKMMRKNLLVLLSIAVLTPCIGKAAPDNPLPVQQDLPNILWLTSEDNSPLLGCYGDPLATSPNLDRLAKQGFLYTHAYANAPVCAPSRNTIITGVYASSSGNENMRSFYSKSEMVRLLPAYLKSIGYYCSNNDKKDYNFSNVDPNAWDESSKTAHYKNRKPGQPFFAVFNTLITHESYLHKRDTGQKLNHDAAAVKLAPYHPDTKEMRRDYARFYDAIESMDKWVGAKLKELDDAGLTENTIVIYYGDHGGIIGRSKRFLYETGTRIPLIIRIPQKFKNLYPAANPGAKLNRLVSLADLLPTMLSITGQSIPAYLQGEAFLGPKKTADPEYVHMFRARMDERIDLSRAVRDKQYRYIRNYMPNRIYGQYIDYLWKAPSMRSWEQAYLNGACNEIQSRFFQTKPVEELYDTEQDPWEVNNLANDPAYKNVLERMRNENNRWMKATFDAGFIPEGVKEEISKKTSLYDYMRSGAQSVDQLIKVSDLANFATAKDVPKLVQYLSDKNAVIRYWAANGLLQLGDKAGAAIPALKKAVTDETPDVAIAAAEALYRLGHQKEGLDVLLMALNNPSVIVRVHAMNAIDNSCKRNEKIREAMAKVLAGQEEKKNDYIFNMATWILNKP